ncbi:MAG TPA: ribonuclease R [Gammaproteobacteria bacterium]|nr:ribonuclease R [bacterium BMS3Abin11]GMT41386.1 MAG: ribonuclease R [bacterium]HDH15301.1 ribonuclease R [Gammaproteobacteria bacterium]
MTKSKKYTEDPFAEREAEKYENPVPSREAILLLLKQAGQLLSLKKILGALNIDDEESKVAIRRRLKAMVRDGQLLRNRKNMYGLAQQMGMTCGLIQGHPDGYGFVIPEAGGEDVFLSAKEMRQVLHGDKVMVRSMEGPRGKLEGSIVEVLQRNNHTVLGHYHVDAGIGYVIPDDRRIGQDILIPQEKSADARQGQIVVAVIDRQPDKHSRPVGHISEVLGEHMAPGMEIEIATRKYELPYIWPDEVSHKAKSLPSEVQEEQTQGRLDLRDQPLVTIDGEDARDFDDAVLSRKIDTGWQLIVAIADVASYVKKGQPLDKEAVKRGNSVYFPEQVIPMLPEKLSNGLCSLNPDVDRLCMVCIMEIDHDGEISDWRFDNAVMRSQARLTYTKVASILVDGDPNLIQEYSSVFEALQNLYDLYQLRYQWRQRQGAMDLDMPETRIIFNDERKIEAIVPQIRNEAHRLIEEFMLAANVCAAKTISDANYPGLYRVHEGPTEEKRDNLRKFLFEIGLSLGGGDEPGVQDYARLLADISQRADAEVIKPMILRSLSQARYTPDCDGHFALGFTHYTHFTSPIRRYPDLQVHRTLKAILYNRTSPYTELELVELGEHCSMTERRADDATRDVMRWLKAEYMVDHVGEEFPGTVSGVTGFGLFVTLDDIYIDGLIHITALGNDYFQFDAAKSRLTGERTRKTYRLGNRLQVMVVRVDVDEGRIDLELVGKDGGAKAGSENKDNRRRKPRTKKSKTKGTNKHGTGKRGKTLSRNKGGKKNSTKQARRGKKNRKPS